MKIKRAIKSKPMSNLRSVVLASAYKKYRNKMPKRMAYLKASSLAFKRVRQARKVNIPKKRKMIWQKRR